MTRGRLAATAFAVGSVCFAVAAFPAIAEAMGAVGVNVVFFIGSVFFTAGAALSLGDPTRSSSVIQLVGTVFFNISTALALAAAVPAGAEGGTGWRPDVYGSACFLISSALAVRPSPPGRERSGAWLNLAGSVLFAAAAIGSFVVPGTDALLSPFWTGLGTVGGALLFLGAALLGLLPAQRAAATAK
ncbi:YrhK family protein [Leifsonia sp. NPDC080035]|uniref:YrhK family protein n=1 Tax=Leifsonia sp. NPDC080035 TaxID=3143936 RepID=A0AAU7GES4_9MICO